MILLVPFYSPVPSPCIHVPGEVTCSADKSDNPQKMPIALSVPISRNTLPWIGSLCCKENNWMQGNNSRN